MESNKKSVLNIKIICLLGLLFSIIVIFLSLTNNSFMKLASTENISYIDINEEQDLENTSTDNIESTNNITEEMQTADTDTFSRTENVTSRSEVVRTDTTDEDIQAEDVQDILINGSKYISIDEIKISRDMDLTQVCGISKTDFKKLLKNTSKDTTDFFYDNSDTIYDLCQEYSINEIFFCGLIAGESGWDIASNHRNTYNYISMMSNGKLIRYSSVENGLESAAKLLHNTYLTPGGSCYSGKTLSAVQTRFCPGSSTWVNLIYTCMSQIV